MKKTRRNFIKNTALASGGIVLGANAMSEIGRAHV